MYLVAIHHWQKNAVETAQIIAEALGILVFEARQKITGGGPVVLASFADQKQAEELAEKLTSLKVPALIIDTQQVRNHNRQYHASAFKLGEQALQVETGDGQLLEFDYATMKLLLIATCSTGQMETTKTTTQRKFSLGKTLLAGGVPMTKKVKTTETITTEDRDTTLWIYTDSGETLILTCNVMNYAGLGDAQKMTRNLNFTHLLTELKRLASQAHYNDQLLKRAGQAQILGQVLTPESDLDLAFAILSQSLRYNPH